jgi:hypothetical protein
MQRRTGAMLAKVSRISGATGEHAEGSICSHSRGGDCRGSAVRRIAAWGNPRERWLAANLFVAKWARNSESACLFCSLCNGRQVFLLQIIPLQGRRTLAGLALAPMKFKIPSIKLWPRGLGRV